MTTEFWFGWLTKPQYQYTYLDTLVVLLELLVLYVVAIGVIAIVSAIKDKIRKKRNGEQND